jgi:hypothetical protein
MSSPFMYRPEASSAPLAHRDHRKLGQQLDLYSINDSGGAGLVFWHPKVWHRCSVAGRDMSRIRPAHPCCAEKCCHSDT